MELEKAEHVTNAKSMVEYYDNRVNSLEMEIRASQSNPVAFYLTV